MTTMTTEITLKASEAIKNIDTKRIEESYLEELSKFGEVLKEDAITVGKTIMENYAALPIGSKMEIEDAEALFYASVEIVETVNEMASEVRFGLLSYWNKALHDRMSMESFGRLESIVHTQQRAVEALEDVTFGSYKQALKIMETFEIYK